MLKVQSSFPSEVEERVKEVELSIFTVNPSRIEQEIASLVSSISSKPDAIRIVGKPSLFTPELVEGIRKELDGAGIKFGIGIIGFPGAELREWKDPSSILEKVDYFVRHVPRRLTSYCTR